MINPLDVAKEIKAITEALTGCTFDQDTTNEAANRYHLDATEMAMELWEKVYAINNCPNCDMEDPEDAWKHGNPEHDPENN